MELNSKRYQDTIIFRDYSKGNIDTVKVYERLKKALANKYANNRKMYTTSKNEFIQEVIEKAYEEQIK